MSNSILYYQWLLFIGRTCIQTAAFRNLLHFTKQQIAILVFFPHRGRYLYFGPTIYRCYRLNLLFLSHYLTCVWGTFLFFFPLLDLFILLYWSLLCVWREFWGCLWALWRVPFGFDILFFEWSLYSDFTVTFLGCFLSLQVISFYFWESLPFSLFVSVQLY